MFDKDEFIDLDTFKVANILACLPQHLRQPLIQSLQTQRPNIGYLSMRFEDLENADNESLKAIINKISYQDLVSAMSTADQQLIQRFQQNLPGPLAKTFAKDVAKLHNSEEPEQFFNAFDAKINVIATAAKLRQSGKVSVPMTESEPDTIPESVVEEIKNELQVACEKAMADVLACYLPEAAAAVLCQRLDRERILEQMLKPKQDDFCDVLNDDEIEQLLCGISDEDVF